VRVAGSSYRRRDRHVRSLVIYEDDMLLALNKPSGLSSQGGRIMAHTLDDLLAPSPSPVVTARA